MGAWPQSDNICAGIPNCSTTRCRRGPKRFDGEVPREQPRSYPSLRGNGRKTLSKKQAWYAKLPSVCKRHIYSFLGHRVAAIAMQAVSSGDRFVSPCLTTIVFLSLARHWFAVWSKTMKALETV